MPACSALPGHVKPKQSCPAFSRRAVAFPSIKVTELQPELDPGGAEGFEPLTSAEQAPVHGDGAAASKG